MSRHFVFVLVLAVVVFVLTSFLVRASYLLLIQVGEAFVALFKDNDLVSVNHGVCQSWAVVLKAVVLELEVVVVAVVVIVELSTSMSLPLSV